MVTEEHMELSLLTLLWNNGCSSFPPVTHFLPCSSTPNISTASKAALPTGEQLLTLTYGDSNSVVIAYRGDQKGYNRGIDKDTHNAI